MYDVVVKGGQIVSGSYGSFRADLAIKGEKIAAIGDGLDGKYVINASGKLVMPGVIDAHVHMELPVSGTRSSDDFSSGTKAAACGGVTTIIDFTVGSSESTIPEDIEKRLKEAEKSHIDYALHAEVIGWHRSRSQEILKAVQMGVTSFKFFTAYGSSGRRTD
ncbi:MAG: amidohydrolase family protein, partial [Acetomicrobium sp.]